MGGRWCVFYAGDPVVEFGGEHIGVSPVVGEGGVEVKDIGGDLVWFDIDVEVVVSCCDDAAGIEPRFGLG